MLSTALSSCTTTCVGIGRTCKPTVTANSIYPFYKAGKHCQDNEIDKTPNGTSYWYSEKEPTTSSGQCQGFMSKNSIVTKLAKAKYVDVFRAKTRYIMEIVDFKP